MFKYRIIAVIVIGLLMTFAGIAMGGKKNGDSRVKSTETKNVGDISNPLFPQAVDPVKTGEADKNGASSTGEQINWQVLSGGGGPMSTTGYILNGTLGQTVAGLTSTTGQSIHQGYWQNFGAVGCCDTPGDANDDGVCDIGDCVYLLNFIFREGAYPVCGDEGDPNGDCSADVGDVVYILSYIYREGPYPVCGCWSY